jgi:hypothetical protein
MSAKFPQVISLSLISPEEMFVLASADLFSEYRNFMTGLELHQRVAKPPLQRTCSDRTSSVR